MNLSNALNTFAPMSLICKTPDVVVPSFMGPKRCAMKTLDRAASTHRCAVNVSPLTSNVTSAPTLV
ncbi:hypothetical protein CFC21_094920 [Triticum aestivum]|uniref:Uncharacterized protein n=2 Tax=Triticum aestivum TaxID=4565 RepID=A0A9R1MWW7_WHEAT|nr:hypothetical protein CFC21_094912 [Triticum aestivum]KAF7092436.1 hypothetical protein CFC21_094920 [Triticum aestivum]